MTDQANRIKKMAELSGFHWEKGDMDRIYGPGQTCDDCTDNLIAFAALVAEDCARVAREIGEVMADRYGVAAECITTAEAIDQAIRSLYPDP